MKKFACFTRESPKEITEFLNDNPFVKVESIVPYALNGDTENYTLFYSYDDENPPKDDSDDEE